jgi:methanethiol S-methyltransferase
VIWSVTDPVAATVIQALSLVGFALVVFSTFLISHFELFGLTQVVRNWLNRQAPEPIFSTPLLYRHVRHPPYLGFLIAFWAAPTMTAGHLLFALALRQPGGVADRSGERFALVAVEMLPRNHSPHML